MSVVVKGMKIPELYETYKVNFAMTNDGKIVMGMCPLNETGFRPVGEVVALPDKHGRLVDADADSLKNKLKLINEAEHQIYGRGSWGFTAKCIHAIDDAPTVIEADDGE